MKTFCYADVCTIYLAGFGALLSPPCKVFRFKEKEPPIISYIYTKTIASKILNFSSTLLDSDYHQFRNNPSPCEYNTSSHLYEPDGHVITGDLSIIPNSKLRDLIAKDPKYRELCKVD